MDQPSRGRVRLPKVGSVRLENFDLYKKAENVEVTIDNDVFCLIGANGLGKSTFLNTICFGITGAIPDPDRSFLSATDYFKNCSRQDRIDDYFGGRLSETARDAAGIVVDLLWPEARVRVRRDLVGSNSVTLLEIDRSDGSPWISTSTTGDFTSDYEQTVLGLSGLEDIAQFVFLIHFVAVFDESRHLLMWDADALTNALYLAFGADAKTALAADQLQHEMEREDSRARNVRFAARGLTDRIKQIEDILKPDAEADPAALASLKTRHESLRRDAKTADQRFHDKRTELRNLEIQWTEQSARLTELQLEYRRLFSSRTAGTPDLHYHPIIRATLSEDQCALCQTKGVADHIREELHRSHCPLCDSELSPRTDDPAETDRLRSIDQRIADLRDELSATLQKRERVEAEVQAARATLEGADSALRAFEEEEARGLAQAEFDGSLAALRKEVERLELERKKLIDKAEEHRGKRDELKNELTQYERRLKSLYSHAAEDFLPRFRELAEEFIGLPVDIQLNARRGANVSGFTLLLKLGDQLRFTSEQLSESQRFFIDIALRMALTDYLTGSHATLLIDTPEGSLDIAYEARAGSMFSRFVDAGNSIIMTANLRSSQLVLRLAEMRGRSGMSVVRMTDWTNLTDVQLAEEKLFDRAYDQIEAALG